MARWYGVNPWQLSDKELFVLAANVDSLWAEEVLRERGGSLTAAQLKTLTLLATDDEAAAEEAWLQKVEEDLRNDKMPDV